MPRVPDGVHSPSLGVAVLVEPGGYVRMPLAWTRWQNGDAGTDGTAVLCAATPGVTRIG